MVKLLEGFIGITCLLITGLIVAHSQTAPSRPAYEYKPPFPEGQPLGHWQLPLTVDFNKNEVKGLQTNDGLPYDLVERLKHESFGGDEPTEDGWFTCWHVGYPYYRVPMLRKDGRYYVDGYDPAGYNWTGANFIWRDIQPVMLNPHITDEEPPPGWYSAKKLDGTWTVLLHADESNGGGGAWGPWGASQAQWWSWVKANHTDIVKLPVDMGIIP